MFFSILAPTLGNRKDELDRLLESLEKQTFTDFEVVVVSQANHEDVAETAAKHDSLKIKHVKLERAGLSYARNMGLPECTGEWIILSDDDAWYPENGLQTVYDCCRSGDFVAVLTQICDPDKNALYKDYSDRESVITSRFGLMSRSSIEIAYKRSAAKGGFDENFGLGAKYVCGEEIDFLLNNYEKGRIKYFPVVSVYHPKKEGRSSDAQIFAKGALYAKHFGRLTAFAITIRDMLKRRKTNRKVFWQGFKDYKNNAHEA